MKVTSLILLAGNSERFKSNLAKQFYLIDNKPLIYYTISSFNNDLIDDIVLVCRKEDVEKVKELVKTYSFSKVKNIVIGGASRSESVSNGLQVVDDGIVLIHDGARPIVNQKVIEGIINNIDKYDCVVPVIKCEDSIVNIAKKYVDRNSLLKVQTPQGFKTSIIKEAYKNIGDKTYTDDASLIENKDRILYINGDKKTLKVTTIEDALFIESILKENNNE